MGQVSQNYSRGKHSPLFSGKSNHPKHGAREGKNSATEEKMGLVLESWKKKEMGKDDRSERKECQGPFFI